MRHEFLVPADLFLVGILEGRGASHDSNCDVYDLHVVLLVVNDHQIRSLIRDSSASFREKS